MNVSLKPGELSGSGPRSTRKTTSIFVAYRFHSEESQHFRDELEKRLKTTDSLKDVDVIDGKSVLLGDDWSGKIREALKGSKLVIGELTALSPEVLFECGYSRGVSRPMLPVVADQTWYPRLPKWLTALQIGNFSDEKGWEMILNTIDKSLNHGQIPKSNAKFPSPDPGQSVWLPGPTWFDARKDSLINVANRYDMNEPIIDLSAHDIENTYQIVIEHVCRASLIVAAIDNVSSDSFVHYACGLVVSKLKAGVSKRKLDRKLVLVVNDKTVPNSILSQSAIRAHHVIHSTDLEGLNNEIIKFGENYRRWRKDCEAIS